jgi:hypothetical protein
VRADPCQKFDLPVLDVAIRLPLSYVDATGSRRTDDDPLVKFSARYGVVLVTPMLADTPGRCRGQ